MREDELSRLPHWARVAFAARCGRAGLRLFRRAWPDADPERLAAVRAAVERAEKSAASGRLADDVKSAALGACMAAGAALRATVPNPAAASLAAKPAEFAARAAAAGPAGSALAASQAFGFAVDAAVECGAGALVAELEADWTRLRRAAEKGWWADDTPVPSTVFGT